MSADSRITAIESNCAYRNHFVTTVLAVIIRTPPILTTLATLRIPPVVPVASPFSASASAREISHAIRGVPGAGALRAFEYRQVLAGGRVGRGDAQQVGPLLARERVPALFRIDEAQRVARVDLTRVEPERKQHLLLGVREHPALFGDQAQVEMSLSLLRRQQSCQPQHFGRALELAVFQVDQAQVEKHLPVVKSQVDRSAVFAQFVPMLSGDAVGEA